MAPDPHKLLRPVLAGLIVAADLGLVLLDYVTGPFLPFTVFYVCLIYFAVTRTSNVWAYVVVVISSLGRTYVASHTFPPGTDFSFVAWQFASSFSVLALICFLFDRRSHGKRSGVPAWLWKVRGSVVTAPAMAGIGGGEAQVGTERYVAVLLLASVGFLAVFVPWIRNAPAPALYCLSQNSTVVARNPVSEVPTALDTTATRKVVVLTIDDAPRDPEIDGRMLATIEQHGVRAVWFVNCKGFDPAVDTKATANLRTLLRLRDGGQLIGNHGYSHLDLKLLEQTDRPLMVREIKRCSAAIQAATGARPTYFRAPFGDVTSGVIRVANQDGMSNMRWSVSYDALFGYNREVAASAPPSKQAINGLVQSLHSGDIVLMHDNFGTAQSLDYFLSELQQQGFAIVLPGRAFNGSAME